MSDLKHLLAVSELRAGIQIAVERAALLACELSAALDLVHLLPPNSHEKLRRLVGEPLTQADGRALDAARRKLRRKAAALLDRHGVAAGVQVLPGTLLHELDAHADALAVDLVVLGAKGGSRLREVLLGSTLERIAHRTRHSLLVVKQMPRTPYSRVLVAVDFSAGALATVRVARQLAPTADFILLHAFEVPFEGKLHLAGATESAIGHYRIAARQEAMERLQVLSLQAGLSAARTRRIALHGESSRHIVEQEEELGCDLIVLGRHVEKTLKGLLAGSTCGHVVTESRGDVLISV